MSDWDVGSTGGGKSSVTKGRVNEGVSDGERYSRQEGTEGKGRGP